MKKLLMILAFMGMCAYLAAQEKPTTEPVQKNYFKFQARIKAGMGQTFSALPMKITGYAAAGDTIISDFKNDFLKTKWGIYGGLNLDFYFHPNFGLGVDVDYFNNKVDFAMPKLLSDYLDNHPITHLLESNKKNQQLIFVGIGPSFKLFTNEHWDIDLNIRGGLSHLMMGSLRYSVDTVDEQENRYELNIINYDYTKAVNAIGIKTGLYVNYWFNSWIGITLGADYIHTFLSADKINDDPEYILEYKDPNLYESENQLNGGEYWWRDMLKYPVKSFNINHVSVSAGLVFRVVPVIKAGPKNKDIVVLVKDSLTSIPVEGVDVSLKDKVGRDISVKKTAANGKVTFENVEPGNYTVSGVKDDLKTMKSAIDKEEFLKKKKVIYRELLLPASTFILAGLTVECDKGDKPIGNVNVELTNKSTGQVEKAISAADGKFTFKLDANTDYSIVANRDMYFSGVQEITTKGLNRSKSMYVKLTLCVDQLEVGKSFVLKNIYYDFDKCDIRKDASVELDRLVDIMKKYPSMEIELSSHTDQRGSDAYNNKLSQCRAESAVNYIVSKGITKSRITAIGYGKTRLLKDCYKESDCSPAPSNDCPCHQNNRRTEVKILKM